MTPREVRLLILMIAAVLVLTRPDPVPAAPPPPIPVIPGCIVIDTGALASLSHCKTHKIWIVHEQGR